MSHTPEPWKIDGASIVDADGFAICETTPRDEEDANAHLIAAAPMLLRVCKEAKKYLEPDLVEPGRTIFWHLVEAIAKAESKGETE